MKEEDFRWYKSDPEIFYANMDTETISAEFLQFHAACERGVKPCLFASESAFPKFPTDAMI